MNVVLSTSEVTHSGFKKNETLLKVVNEYGRFLQYAINIQVKEENNKPQVKSENMENPEEVSQEVRIMIKKTEADIECKLLAIDTFRLICSFFIKEGNF